MPDSGAPGGFRVQEELVWLDGFRPVLSVRPNATTGMTSPDYYPILTDYLGTPRKVLNDDGDVAWSWDAKEPFGNSAPNENPAALGTFKFNLRFPGQWFDTETGLYHNGFRDYHPGLGRYVQSDPLGLEAGWNTYAYVGGSPLGYSDPFGLDIIQDAFDYWQPPALPQGVVDFSAGWGDTLTSVPFTEFSATQYIRRKLGTDSVVNCGSGAYTFGMAAGIFNGALIGGGGGGYAALRYGQRGVPKGMVKVTRWGRPGLRDGDWVGVGGANKFTKGLSGVVGSKYPMSSAQTFIVPKNTLASPILHRPSNEPKALATIKNFIGINYIQKVYKP